MPGILIALAEAPEYRVVVANVSSDRMFDAPVDAIVGANLLDVLDRRGGLGPLRDTIRDAIVSDEACNAHIRFDTDERLGERQLTVIPIHNDGDPRAIRATIADSDSAAIGELPPLDAIVNVISHELRSPLNAALIWASLLEMDHTPATAQKAAAIIRDSVLTQTRLIDDLVDVTRGASGANPPTLESIDLGALIDQSLADTRASFPSIVDANAQVLGQPSMVSGDRVQLDRVVRHLIRNAASAMSEGGGTVSINLARDADHAFVTVTDGGIGMTAEQIGSTFRPFWQPDRRFSGAGLGLGVVRTIVARHGGSVCARSGGLGSGAAVTFSLPIRRD